jgi:hypothetical protein
MMYLIHPGYEVVTEISRRQDLNQRGNMGGYWFSLQYMAIHDSNGRYMTLAKHFEPTHASLAAFMEYPELNVAGPKPEPIPDRYERQFQGIDLVRIRRGDVSASVFTKGNSRVFTLRKGEAVINAVRFVSAFFGKSQFVPDRFEKRGGSYFMTQSLQAPYYQPFTPTRQIAASEWTSTQKLRPQSEICRLEQSATITETKGGFRVRVQADGTKNVPLAIEINFREGGKLEGVAPMYKVEDGWALASGQGSYRMGGDVIRFGPGLHEHSFTTQMRGALPKLSGPSVYLTGFTPFDHTIDFEV